MNPHHFGTKPPHSPAIDRAVTHSRHQSQNTRSRILSFESPRRNNYNNNNNNNNNNDDNNTLRAQCGLRAANNEFNNIIILHEMYMDEYLLHSITFYYCM
jgi:hypothetical protein